MKKTTDASTLILRGMVGPVILALVLLPVIIFTPTPSFGLVKQLESLATWAGVIESGLKRSVALINGYKAEILTMETRIGVLENTVSYYDSQISSLEASKSIAWNNYTAAGTRLSGYQVELAHAEADISYALDMLYDLSGSSTSSGVIDYWREKLRDARARKSAAEANIKTAEADAASAMATIDSLDSQISTIKIEKLLVYEEISREQQNIAAVTNLIQGLESNISSEQRQLNQVREDMKALENRIALLESTIQTLESTIQTLESTIQTLLANEVENKEEIQRLRGEIQRLQGEIQQLRNQLGY